MNQIDRKIILYAKLFGSISVPQIQKNMSLTYSQAREAIRQLVESNILTPDGELNFKRKEATKYTGHMRPDSKTEILGRTSREKQLPETPISQAEQNRIDSDCSDEKYAEFIEESKKNDSDKIKLVCRKKDSAYSKVIDDFNKLPASSQLKLRDTMAHSGKVGRYELYQLLREEGDCRVKYSNEYISYSVAMSFLLQTSDSAFEVLKKTLKIK